MSGILNPAVCAIRQAGRSFEHPSLQQGFNELFGTREASLLTGHRRKGQGAKKG
jgi:hypothetical protein